MKDNVSSNQTANNRKSQNIPRVSPFSSGTFLFSSLFFFSNLLPHAGVSGTNGRHVIWDACEGQYANFPFCDTSKSLDDRLNDLISRVPLNSIGQQQTARESAQLDNIGVPSYYWG